MAFNDTKNEPIINSGFITSSRGLPPNEAFGELFKGLGNTMNNYLQSKDTETRTNISLDAQSMVEDEATKATPPAVTESVQGIKDLQNAKAQGMSESEYQTRLMARIKEARTKVPKGYWDVLDSAVASAQGTSTADQLRRARLAEQEALSRKMEANMDSESKAFNTYYGQNEESIMSQQGLDLYERLFKKKFGLDTANLRELQVVVGAVKGHEADLVKAKAAAEIDEKNAFKATATQVWSATNKLMSEANPIFKDFQQRFNTAASDNAITDEERAALMPIWSNFRSDIVRKITMQLSAVDDPNVIKLGKEQRANLLSDLNTRLDSWEEMFKSPTAQSLKLLTDSISLRHAVSENKLLKAPYVEMYVTAQKMGWKKEDLDDILKGTQSQFGNKNAYDDLQKGLSDALTLGIITNQTTLGQGLKDMGEDATKETKVALINKHMEILAKPTATPDQVTQIGEAIFNEDLDTVLEDFARKDNRVALFEKFMNPAVAERLMKSDAAEKFATWANKQMRVIGAEAGDLILDAQKTSEIAKLSFDGKQFRLDPISPRGLVATTDLGALWEQYKLKDATRAVYNMNKYLRLMDPVWKKEFGEGYDAGSIMVNIMGQDVNKTVKSGSLLSNMLETVGQHLTGPEGPLGEDTMDKAKKNLPPDGSNMQPSDDHSEAPSMTGRSLVSYANEGATRNLDLTNELEGKISTAVSTVLGDGYTAQVFSGGQPKKGTSKKRTGSIRHDEGKAADVYIIGPNGKRVTDTKVLDKLKEYWLKNDMGSVGTYMRGAGMHLDEWTKEELLAGMGQTWKY
jgi:hypothetical protein